MPISASWPATALQFFAAFRNNELDYAQFYATLTGLDVAKLIRNEVKEPNARFITRFIGSDPQDIRRVIDNPGQPKRRNVVLVTIESFSASYLGSFGDSRGLTPNLDELRKHSLFFSNFYATGTRTDRGLEAITLPLSQFRHGLPSFFMCPIAGSTVLHR